MFASASTAADLHSSKKFEPAGGSGRPARIASMSFLIFVGLYFRGYRRRGIPVRPSIRNFSKFPSTRPRPAGVRQLLCIHLQNGMALLPKRSALSVKMVEGLIPNTCTAVGGFCGLNLNVLSKNLSLSGPGPTRDDKYKIKTKIFHSPTC